jgi:hypothetical protein
VVSENSKFERPLEVVVVPANKEVPARRLCCETPLLLRKTVRFRFDRRHPPRKKKKRENDSCHYITEGVFPGRTSLEIESPNAARTEGEREDP